ncbi:transcriptional regulator [Enterobacter hormaechei]
MNHVIQKAIRVAGSQANLAKMIGVGQSTISKWLNGAEISSRYISALVTAMGGKVTAEEILQSLNDLQERNSKANAA